MRVYTGRLVRTDGRRAETGQETIAAALPIFAIRRDSSGTRYDVDGVGLDESVTNRRATVPLRSYPVIATTSSIRPRRRAGTVRLGAAGMILRLIDRARYGSDFVRFVRSFPLATAKAVFTFRYRNSRTPAYVQTVCRIFGGRRSPTVTKNGSTQFPRFR